MNREELIKQTDVESSQYRVDDYQSPKFQDQNSTIKKVIKRPKSSLACTQISLKKTSQMKKLQEKIHDIENKIMVMKSS
jgi:hypothetical protein